MSTDYRITATPMTLNDFQGHTASPLKRESSNVFATFDNISTDTARCAVSD